MDDDNDVVDLLGIYDNFGEPKPLWNEDKFVVAIVTTFLLTTWICVVFRIYTRLRIIYSPGWDDVFVVLFLISGTTCSLAIIIATQYGLGHHYLLLSLVEMERYGKLVYVWNATYCMSTMFIKLSLLFQYLRIFQDTGIRRYLCITLIVLTAVWGCGFSFIAWFPCFPVGSSNFDKTCYGFESRKPAIFYRTYMILNGTNITLDMLILFLPLPIYFRRNTQRNTKLGLLALFFMGGLVSVLAIWRLATIIEHRAATYPTLDPTWYGCINMILASLEVNAASICASVPVFWPIITARIDNIFVTREFKIETTDRHSKMEEEENELGDLSQRGSFGPDDSQEHLTRNENSQKLCGGSGNHYKDDYIISQVDPFRQVLGVASKITSERLPQKS